MEIPSCQLTTMWSTMCTPTNGCCPMCKNTSQNRKPTKVSINRTEAKDKENWCKVAEKPEEFAQLWDLFVKADNEPNSNMAAPEDLLGLKMDKEKDMMSTEDSLRPPPQSNPVLPIPCSLGPDYAMIDDLDQNSPNYGDYRPSYWLRSMAMPNNKTKLMPDESKSSGWMAGSTRHDKPVNQASFANWSRIGKSSTREDSGIMPPGWTPSTPEQLSWLLERPLASKLCSDTIKLRAAQGAGEGMVSKWGEWHSLASLTETSFVAGARLVKYATLTPLRELEVCVQLNNSWPTWRGAPRP